MDSKTPKFFVFSHKDDNYKQIFSDIYKDLPINEFSLSHKTDFHSKSYYHQKFGQNLLKTTKFTEILDKILDSFEKISKTKVFSEGNVDFSLEGDKMLINLHIHEKSRFDGNFHWKIADKNSIFLLTKFSFLYRNPLNRMDSHKIEVLSSFFEITRNLSGMRFSSTFPFLIPNSITKFSFSHKNQLLHANIEENSSSEKLRYFPLKKHWILDFKHKSLQNHYNIKQISQYTLNEQIFPCEEYSLKISSVFYNNIEKNIVNSGKKAQGSLLVGFNDNYSNYMKMSFFARIYSQIFDKSTQKRYDWRYINLENTVNIGVYVPFQKNKENLMNNLINMKNRVPGFKILKNSNEKIIEKTNENSIEKTNENSNENVGYFNGNQFFGITSFRMNFYDYPLLKLAGISPFIHLTGAIVADNLKDLRTIKRFVKESSRASVGVGARFMLWGQDLEVMYNFGHLGRKGDVAAKFQIALCK